MISLYYNVSEQAVQPSEQSYDDFSWYCDIPCFLYHAVGRN